MFRRLLKWTFRGLVIVVLLVVLVVAGTFFWLRGSVPELTARYTLAGLEKPVTIIRDKNGIPHIYAESERDAYFALGFVHAQDRLFQMIMQRRIGQGRLAELIGSRGVKADRFMRVLGLYRRAQTSVAALRPETRRGLETYAAGVNAYIAARKELLPPEFNILLHQPEPWTAADSLLWGKMMALQLGTNWRSELSRLALIQTVGAERARQLDPAYPANGPITHAALDAPRPDPLMAAIPWALVGNGASNEWAIAGGRTASGEPLVANDPHLRMTAPPMWYLVRIETPSLKISGATVPGVPVHLVGHNGHVGWGVTTPYIDTSDVFVERIDPSDPNRYLTPDGPAPFVTRTETIKVRFGDPVEMTVRETRHGPVISDLPHGAKPGIAKGQVLALQATWLTDADTTADAMYAINRATDWASFREGLRRYIVPSQNFAVADTKGTIAHITPGRIPIRKEGNGRLPVPGWDGKHDWVSFIPFDLVPQGTDPTKGFFVNSNNRIVGPDYPFFLSEDWGDHYRATRVTELLEAQAKSTPETTAAVQGDVVSLPARTLLPLMLSTPPDSTHEHTALALLKAWDGKMDRHKPEPLIYTAWMYELGRALFTDELGAGRARRMAFDADVLKAVLTRYPAWCDDVRTAAKEDCAAMLHRSLEAAVARLSETYGDSPADWRWGRAHMLNARHPLFGFVPVLRDFTGLRIATDGGQHTVNKAAMAGREPHPFAQASGPGMRAIMPFDDLARSRFIIAGGQSGNPYSPFFDNLLVAWRDIRYVTFSHDRAALEKDAAGTLTLVPKTAQR